MFCTNRVLAALDQEPIRPEDLAHLRPKADELEALRTAGESQATPSPQLGPTASEQPPQSRT